MTDQTHVKQKPNYRTTSDAALLAAWKRFIEFDDASNNLKRLHSWTRSWIIILVLAASTLAVLMAYQGGDAGLGNWNTPKIVGTVLHVLLIITPLLAAGIMTFAYMFSPSQSWIAYRVGAELIRKHIYLYRLQGGDYAGKTAYEQQDLLLQNVHAASKQVIDLGARNPFMQRVKDNVIVSRITKLTDSSADDGFGEMTVDEYIEHRVVHQRDWYIHRTQDDFVKLRTWNIVIIVITVVSSMLAAFGGQLAPWVAVTTATSVAAKMYIDLRMFGRTYSIYHRAADQSGNEVERWRIKTAQKEAEPRQVAEFVKTIEGIFQDERNAWMEQAMQAAATSEQALMKSVGRDPETFRSNGHNPQEQPEVD